jgi:acetylxylan esterase
MSITVTSPEITANSNFLPSLVKIDTMFTFFYCIFTFIFLPSQALAALPTRGLFQLVTAPYTSTNTSTKFYIYIPNALESDPSIVVAIHYCTGTATAYVNGLDYRPYSEKYNFITIYPESPEHANRCWDVSSRASLVQDGGGESQAIVDMVRWTRREFGRGEITGVRGTSSGAMMTVGA